MVANCDFPTTVSGGIVARRSLVNSGRRRVEDADSSKRRFYEQNPMIGEDRDQQFIRETQLAFGFSPVDIVVVRLSVRNSDD